MGRFLGLKATRSLHKKQISIESRVDRTVEDDIRIDLEWRTKTEPQVSVTIGRASEVPMECYPKFATSDADPLVCLCISLSGSPANVCQQWPRWKVEVAYISLVMLTSTASLLKFVLTPLTAVLSNEFDISYLKAACLTGVPVILSVPATLGSSLLACILGRRAVAATGSLLLFTGSILSLERGISYNHFMIARALQGAGWGLIDAVSSNAVADLFFVSVHSQNFLTTLTDTT